MTKAEFVAKLDEQCNKCNLADGEVAVDIYEIRWFRGVSDIATVVFEYVDTNDVIEYHKLPVVPDMLDHVSEELEFRFSGKSSTV